MKYFYFVLTFVYAFAAVGNFYTAGTDPVMNIIISFICLIGCGLFAWLTVWADEIHGNTPEHAVPGNVPPEEDLDEPAYIRRSYLAYRDAWNNGDERADHVSCTRLVSYNEFKNYYMNNMDECPFRV